MKKSILKFIAPAALLAVISLSSFKSTESFNAPQMDLQTVTFNNLNSSASVGAFIRIAVTKQFNDTEYKKQLVQSAVSAGSILEYNSKVEEVLSKY